MGLQGEGTKDLGVRTRPVELTERGKICFPGATSIFPRSPLLAPHPPTVMSRFADEWAVRGFAQAFKEVLRHREVRDIWDEFGLEEIEDPSDDNLSGGLRGSNMSDTAESANSADGEFDSEASDASEESLAMPKGKRRLYGL